MSQLVRLEGKHTTQTAHCAMVKSRFDQPEVRTVVHPAKNGLIHMKMVDVEYPRVITSKVNLFSRPDQ